MWTWLVTSKLGRALAAGLAIAAALALAALKLISIGKRAERARQDRASLDNLRNRQRTDEDIENLGHADLDRRMHRWVRDGKR